MPRHSDVAGAKNAGGISVRQSSVIIGGEGRRKKMAALPGLAFNHGGISHRNLGSPCMNLGPSIELDIADESQHIIDLCFATPTFGRKVAKKATD